MGFFSWKTSDTEKSIPSHYSSRPTFKVHMITEDGQVFTEDNYEGYGVFGGKDLYVLAAEMNGFKGNTDDDTRQNFFDKIWLRGVQEGDVKLTYNIDFKNYQAPIPSQMGKTANQLIEFDGWKSFGDNGGFKYWSDLGFKMPKLVEELECEPTNKEEWKQYWDRLDYPLDCPDQGFFYPDDDEDDVCSCCGTTLEGSWCPDCEEDMD